MVSRRDSPAESVERARERQHARGGRELTDEQLAVRMFAGDEKATWQLLERFRGPLYGTLVRFTRNPADAEELFQETFVRALGAGSRFDPSRRFKPWIFAIAINLARDRAKRAAHRATPELRAADDLPEDDADRPESRWIRRVDLDRALGELSEDHREVIELRYFEGMEEPEIADAAGIPRGTVKSRLHHAIRKLRDLLAAGDAT